MLTFNVQGGISVVELGCISLPGNYSYINKVSPAMFTLKKQFPSLHLSTFFSIPPGSNTKETDRRPRLSEKQCLLIVFLDDKV